MFLLLKAPFLTIGGWRCHKYIFTNHQLMTNSINDGVVYRTAPATPGLLNIVRLQKAAQSTSHPLLRC